MITLCVGLFTVVVVYSDCRDNKPSYSALKLGSKFDLDEITNYEKASYMLSISNKS